MSGQWPPEWEDSDTGLPDDWTVDDAGVDPEASGVTSFLVSVPSPVLPAAFEARISAAIAAEATARANGTAPAVAGFAATEPVRTGSAGAGGADAGADDAETTDRSSSPKFPLAAAAKDSPTTARHRRRRPAAGSRAGRKSGPAGSRPGGRRRRFRMPSPAVSASLLIVLIIAGFGVLVSQFSGGPTYSGTTATSGTAAGSVAGPSSRHSGFASRDGASVPQYETTRPGTSGQKVNFAVTESGISYQGSTLARQVRDQVALNRTAVLPPASPVPNSASASAAASSSAADAPSASAAAGAPSQRLTGCVSRVTDGLTPTLVDQASYQGTPAYIIAVPSRVWVVRLGCTAADPQEITSVSLTGLSGNLRALGSVEGYASPGERRM
jgi:hypothetical protein